VTPALTDLSAGHVFDPVTFLLDAGRVRDYVAATGDEYATYEGLGAAPPLAVAAFALGTLLEQVHLPEGTLHLSEALSFQAPLPLGAAVEARSRLAQRSTRAGMVVSVIETEVVFDGRTALTARATVMSPGAGS
jgi:hypothetical protein